HPIYLNKPLFEHLAFNVQIGLEKFDLIERSSFKEFSFLNTALTIQGDAKKKQFLCNIEAHPIDKEITTGILLCQITSNQFTSFDLSKDNMHLSLSCKDIPSSLFDTLIGYKQALKTIVGEAFESNLDIDCKEGVSFITSK